MRSSVSRASLPEVPAEHEGQADGHQDEAEEEVRLADLPHRGDGRGHRQHGVEGDGVELLAVRRAGQDVASASGPELVLDAVPDALEPLRGSAPDEGGHEGGDRDDGQDRLVHVRREVTCPAPPGRAAGSQVSLSRGLGDRSPVQADTSTPSCFMPKMTAFGLRVAGAQS